MTGIPFIKMHGLGNDFVVLDARDRPLALDASITRAIADRHVGVGCDQVITIEPAADSGIDAFMRIRNADGGEVDACGNAARCVAALLMGENGNATATIATAGGLLHAEAAGDGEITVDMGEARLDWRDIPLAHEADTLRVPFETDSAPAPEAVCVSMGNPHAVFFVADIDAVDLAAIGPKLEHHPIFPARANIGIAQIVARSHIRLRVWERGAGITQACGTGACAALVAAHRRDLADQSAEIALDGGNLWVNWGADGHVRMTGPAATSFTGTLSPTLSAFAS